MKVFPNAHNNRILLLFAICLLTGAVISGILAMVVPHFPGWQAVGPATLMLLLALFVIPYSLRPQPSAR